MEDDEKRALELLRKRFDHDYEARTSLEARRDLMSRVATLVKQVKGIEVVQKDEDTWSFAEPNAYACRVVKVTPHGFKQFSADRKDGETLGTPVLFEERDLHFNKDNGEIVCKQPGKTALLYIVEGIVKNLG